MKAHSHQAPDAHARSTAPEKLRSTGGPTEAGTGSLEEPRVGHHFGRVRVNAGDRLVGVAEPQAGTDTTAAIFGPSGVAVTRLGRSKPVVQRQDTPQQQGRPVNPEVAQRDANTYVDLFDAVYYDYDYRHEGGSLSKWLTVIYSDGTIIDIHLDDIVEESVSPETRIEMMAQGRLGDGGRIFPSRMNPATTPRLYAAKRSAIEAMEEYNFQFILATTPVVLFVITLPLAVRAGGPPRATRMPVTRAAGRAATAGPQAASGVEATVQAALRPNTLRHIFGQARHKLDSLVQRLGSEEAVVRSVATALHRAVLPQAGQYEVTVIVSGASVTVRGAIVEGVVRISTFFIP